MSLDQLLMALGSMAIWELLRRSGLSALTWYRTRDAFTKLLRLDGEVVVARSVVEREGASFVRDSDTDPERVVSTAVGPNATHEPDGFMISNPAHHLVVVGSPRFNLAARQVQEYFALPYQFVFATWSEEAAKRELQVVTKYGDELSSSVDRGGHTRAQEIDYGILFLANLSNGKRLIWIGGIHGAGTLGVAKFLRTEARKVRSVMPKGPDMGVAWLVRVRYKREAGKPPVITNAESLGDAIPVSRHTTAKAGALICDFGSVIMDFDRTRTYRAIGYVLDRNFESVKNVIEATDVRQRYESGDLDTDSFLNALYELLGCNEAVLPRPMLKELWGDIFWEKPQMREALRALHQQRVPLVLLSNTNELHFEHVKKDYPDLIDLFDEVVLSFRVRATKPDRRIFDEAMMAVHQRRKDLKVSDVVFVDDKSEHVQVAESMGMRGFTYRSFAQLVFWLRQRGLYVD